MKTADSENPNHGVAWPRNRAHGAVCQNRSRLIKWAEKQEKFQPKEVCFFLTSPFIELTRHLNLASSRGRKKLISYNEVSALAYVIQHPDFGTSPLPHPVPAPSKSCPLSVGFRSRSCPDAT